MEKYDYIIVGAGICGCSTAYELLQTNKNLNILLVDKGEDVASGGSGAAGAFLSPLLGKPNDFKDHITTALRYSTNFYKKNFSDNIINCGTTRIPKNAEDTRKFEEYKPYMDFDFTIDKDGYFFDVGSVVNSYDVCKSMVENIKTKFDYDVNNLTFDGEDWILNDKLHTKHLILTTGYETNLLEQSYLKIRAVWGRRIDVSTTTKVPYNYHKECSISKSIKNESDDYIVSIGATHSRDKKGVKNREENNLELLNKAKDILKLDNIRVVKSYVGARASSVDYLPLLGELIDEDKTVKEFPYLKNGTNVESKRFIRYKNLSILNGVGGRGFVLAPYLAKQLVQNIIYNKRIDESLKVDRLFKREVRRVNR